VRGLLLLLMLVPGTAMSQETLALLLVDGKPVGDEPEMIDPQAVAFPPARWMELGATLPGNLHSRDTLTADELGVAVEYDSQAAEVRLRIPAQLRPRQTIGSRRQLPTQISPMPKGVLLDYDVATLTDKNTQRASVGHTMRTGLGGGVFSTTGQANWSDGQTHYVRGTTQWRRDFLSSGTTLAVGDVAVPAGGVSNSAVLGGVRIGTDRSLTRFSGGFDIPTIGGLADTRSTAEVFVNEQRRASGELQPGPFQLDRGIAAPGLNNLQLVQRDGFGREQSISRTFYTHADLLGKGSTEWGVVAGAVRPRSVEDRYDGWAGAASGSWGLSDRWTLGAAAQAGSRDGRGGQHFTLSNTLSLGGAGLLQAHVSGSQNETGQTGHAFRASWERRSRDWSASATHLQRSEHYWDVSALLDRTLPIERETNATLSFHPRGGQWRGNLSYTGVQSRGRDFEQMAASVAYNRPGMSISAGVAHEFGRGDTQAQVALRLSNPRAGQTVYTARSAPVLGTTLEASTSGVAALAGRDVRYQVAGTVGDAWQTYGRVDAQLAGGDAHAELRSGSMLPTMLTTQYRNSVWLGEGGVLNGRGNSSGLSYALVEVPEQADMAVLGGRTPLKTNKRGYAFVSGLSPLSTASMTIDPLALPLDVSIEANRVEVVPGRGAGAKATFPIQRIASRQFTVLLEGHEVSEGAEAVSDTGERFRIGQRGVLVLHKPARSVRIEGTFGSCEAVLPIDGGQVNCDLAKTGIAD